MTSRPYFSIVLSTYGRGEHIRPTIESVLGQTHSDFELIVVGDGCADETEAIVESFANDKIIWRNLPANTGSQSLPNNEGIRCARGGWICYLGHDDIWSPDHLSCLAQVIWTHDGSDFIVSGCIYYEPKDSGFYLITGLFEPCRLFASANPAALCSNCTMLCPAASSCSTPFDLLPLANGVTVSEAD